MMLSRLLNRTCMLIAALAPCVQPSMADSLKFPIFITEAADLDRFGISLPEWGAGSAVEYPNNCHYYGDGGYDISISREFLARFKARGFTRRSLCMAIQGGIRFDPETGKHLPTFISVDTEELAKAGKYPEPGIISDELPLDVPQCFSGGLPYTDCDMKYDPLSGERLSSRDRKKYRTIGKKIERTLRSDARRKSFSYFQDSSAPGSTIYVGGGQASLSPDELSRASFYDYSDTFPNGYGYALYADGAAGPDADSEAVELARDSKQKATEAVLKEVEKLLQKE